MSEHYDAMYGRFDIGVHERIRRETYDEDIGQNSWLTADEYRAWIDWLALAPEADVLEVGSGSGGPALFLARTTGARVTGLDVSAAGVAAGTAQARAHGLDDRVRFLRADATRPLAFADGRFNAVVCIDAINHLPDRAAVLAEWRRILRHGGRLLFTDPTVVTGPVSDEEVAARTLNGPSTFAQPGEDERLLAAAGFRLLRREDATANAALVAGRRLAARARHRVELIAVEGEEKFELGQRLYAAVRTLAAEGRLSRHVFLAER